MTEKMMFSKVIWSVITLVVLLTVVGLIYWLTIKPLKRKPKLKWYKIHPSEKITSQPLFWLCISLPVTFGLMLGFPVWIKYSLSYDTEAYTKFIEISALPLGFVLCAMYLVHVLIRVHSSSQTAQQLLNQEKQIDNQKAQIKLQTQQVKNQKDQVQLKNYLDFKDYIIKKLEAIEKDSAYKIIDKHSFFRFLFPDFSPLNCDLGELNSKPKFIFDLQMQIYQITRRYLKDMEQKRSEIGPENWDVFTSTLVTDFNKRIEAENNIIITTHNYLTNQQIFLNKNGVVINSEFRLCNTNKGPSNTNIVSFMHDKYHFRISYQHEYVIDFLERISNICILDSSDIRRRNEKSFVQKDIDRLSDRFEDSCQILNDYISNEKGELIFANNTK